MTAIDYFEKLKVSLGHKAERMKEEFMCIALKRDPTRKGDSVAHTIACPTANETEIRPSTNLK